MHSSRMRTARFSGHLGGGGGVEQGVVCLDGGCLHGGVYVGGGGGRGSDRHSRRHPYVDRMAYACENITFPQLRLRAVNILFFDFQFVLIRLIYKW